MDPLKNKESLFCKEYLPNFQHAQNVSGGLIHRVIKLETDSQQDFYLKVRSPEISQVEGIRVEKEDIYFEYSALQFFSEKLPGLFPTPLACDSKEGFLLMKDALPGGITLQKFLENAHLDDFVSMAGILGKALGNIHKVSNAGKGLISFNKNNDFAEILRFRYEYLHLRRLDTVIRKIEKNSDSVLLGGLSPKNILVTKEKVAFVDLETACLGHLLFDYSFGIAHILLHALSRGELDLAIYKAYETGYLKNAASIPLEGDIVTLIFGTILYRIKNEVVPYPLPIEPQKRERLITTCESLLSGDSNLTIDSLKNLLED